MIHAKVKLSWAPSAVTAAIRRETKAAVRKGADRVRRETMQALNVSGQAAVTKTGLNRLSAAEKRGKTVTQQNEYMKLRGMGRVAGLTTVKGVRVNKSITFNGSYKGVSRIYWNSTTHKWTTSSAPGTPPHAQSRKLREIAVQPINEGYRARVGTGNGLKYARIQELGGKGLIRLPARPYLQPSFQKMIPAIMQDFRVAIAKATS